MPSILPQTLFGASANLPILVDKIFGATGAARIIRTICSFLGISLIVGFVSLRLHANALFPHYAEATDFDACTTLAFGQTVADSIASAGESDCFVFNAAANDRVRVRAVRKSGNLTAYFEIVDVTVNRSVCSTILGEINCLLQTSGEHQLVVKDFNDTHTGAYSLFLQRLNDPIGCSPLSFGALPITGTISTFAESDCFTFEARIADTVRIRAVETAGNNFNARFEVFYSNGIALCSAIIVEKDCQIDLTGQYTIMVKDIDGTRSGSYTLVVQRLNQPVGCSILAFGALPTMAQIDVAAEMDCYTFSATANDTIRIRAIETGSSALSIYFELFDPDGGAVCSYINPERSCTVMVDGQYTLLTKDFAGSKNGAYSLYLQRLNAPQGCNDLGLSGVQIGTIDVAAQVNCYRFQSNGIGTLNLYVHEITGQLSIYSEIVSSDGTTLCQTIMDDLACPLKSAGEHTILIKDSRGTLTGTYQITLQCTLGTCATVATPTPAVPPATLTPTPTLPVVTPTPTPRADSEHPVFIPYVMR